MCLFSSTPIPTILEEDLYCYKKLYLFKGTFITPYRFVGVKVPGKLVGEGPRKVLPITSPYRGTKYSITSGYIHAYLRCFFITETITYQLQFQSRRHHIALCKIHKGTKVYFSNYPSGDREVCAQEMEIIKIIV